MFNTEKQYGWVAKTIHWLMAIAIIAMFALGLWMRELDYYSPYYRVAPDLHKSFGIVLFVLLTLRVVWSAINPKPKHDGLTPFLRTASKLGHVALYLLLFVLMIAGYFISTADGRPILVFGTFEVPAVVTQKGLEVIAGTIHYYVAFIVIGLAGLHAGAALHHHFIKKDNVLRSMTIGTRGQRRALEETSST